VAGPGVPGIPAPQDGAAPSPAQPVAPPPDEALDGATSGQRFEAAQLVARFLIGAVLLGGDDLVGRLRQLPQKLETDAAGEQNLDIRDEKTSDRLRHFGVGLLARGRKRVANGLYNGLAVSLGAADWLAHKLEGWTDNWLARPLRRPVEARWERLVRGISRIVDEGRLEEQNDRLLAGQALDDMVDRILAYMSQDPELGRLVLEQVQYQSSGLADVVATSTRHVTVAGDDAVEGLVRRVLRRKPRRDLSPSPLLGKAQDMYREKARK
jgi:hypothetical protein